MNRDQPPLSPAEPAPPLPKQRTEEDVINQLIGGFVGYLSAKSPQDRAIGVEIMRAALNAYVSACILSRELVLLHVDPMQCNQRWKIANAPESHVCRLPTGHAGNHRCAIDGLQLNNQDKS